MPCWCPWRKDGTMAVMMTLPHGRPLTRADLADMPDDGHRYELVDGVLVVSPAPRLRHQRAVRELLVLLHSACPDDLEVLSAPFDVVLAEDTVLLPDLLVARRSDLNESCLPAPPVLAVEVLSPSTRLVDLLLKRSRLEAAGVPSYWVVDPEEPSLIAWQLVGAAYQEVARVVADERFQTRMPFDVEIVPARLVSGR
jgi:Uma2 family endonuclease